MLTAQVESFSIISGTFGFAEISTITNTSGISLRFWVRFFRYCQLLSKTPFQENNVVFRKKVE